jgi:hypothetical protein
LGGARRRRCSAPTTACLRDPRGVFPCP